MNAQEVEQVSVGRIGAAQALGATLGLMGPAVTSPVVIGVGAAAVIYYA